MGLTYWQLPQTAGPSQSHQSGVQVSAWGPIDSPQGSQVRGPAMVTAGVACRAAVFVMTTVLYGSIRLSQEGSAPCCNFPS